jgi:tetratricopeptide (TPR) repeat protein
MKRTVLSFALISLAMLQLSPAFATCGGGGGGGMGGFDSPKVYDVPWKRYTDSSTPIKSGLILYWLPESEADYQKSSLKLSRTLTMYASRCVSMCVVDANSKIAQKLTGAENKAPLVALATPDGTLLKKFAANNGDLKVEDVESFVNDEMKNHRQSLADKLDAALNKADSGDKQGAIDDLKSIVSQKCIAPAIARRAAKELRRLGVDEVSSIQDAPKLEKSLSAKITKLMLAGLKAEDDSNYGKALELYESAHKLDPADPVPLRFLGELHRHDIGDWDKATEIYKEILSMDADPLSQAVALQGLGKITIHNGEFLKGEQLMEESLKVFPLALACRNLAVYWNSEGDSAKCNYYIDEALKLAPQDSFNRIFAAVFMAGNGRKEEALKIAQDHENLLPASYNLAAIYAQLGMKEKALALLRRHFFEYERNQAVRAEEMMEARVDRVFDSLVNDKDFLALTSGADGKLPMRAGKTAH